MVHCAGLLVELFRGSPDDFDDFGRPEFEEDVSQAASNRTEARDAVQQRAKRIV
jgi:hypothetical protein